MVNAHSHAFQRDLRGAAERPAPEAHAADDFWSWRTTMFALADRLDPASMREVAGRVYAEMAAAGYGAVGEFHYVHHRPDGTPYDEPNAMAHAVAEAARAAGLRIVLLPAAYHRDGWDGGDLPPAAGQRRFCDPDVDDLPRARRRAARLGGGPRGRRGRRGRPQRARRPRGLARGDRRLRRTRTASSATCTPTSSRASSPSATPSTAARRSSCCTAPGSSVRARASCTASTSPATTSRGSPRPTASSSPAPRPRAASGDGWFPAHAPPRRRRAHRDRQRLPGPRRPVRGGARARDRRAPRAPHPPRAARRRRRSVGRAVRDGRRLARPRRRRRDRVDTAHPDLAGVAPDDLPLALATCASAAVVARPA